VYGAIKSINALGPTHIINLVLPKMEQIFKAVNATTEGNFKDFTKFAESLNPSQGDQMQVDQEIGHTYQQSMGENVPKISFSLPAFNVPIQSSIFSEISHTNVVNFNIESEMLNGENKPNHENKMMQSLMKNNTVRSNSNLVKRAFYAYYALKVNYYVNSF
jgi:hypothetical protein